MIDGFSFEADGRKYDCTVEKTRFPKAEPRWWFAVTGDQQRYAPFEAAKADTQARVKKRVLAFYNDLLFRRAQPPEPRSQFGNRGRPPGSGKKKEELVELDGDE